MLDIRLIRDQSALVKERLALRGNDGAQQIDEILECDRQRRGAETRLQQLQSERKRLSKEIGQRRAQGANVDSPDLSALETASREKGEEIVELEKAATKW